MSEQALIELIVSQRWFGSKSREVVGARVVDTLRVPAFRIELVEIRFPEGTHELYQLILGEGEGDAFADPTVARELVHLIRSGETTQAEEGTVEFRAVPGFAALGRELGSPRAVDTEQSNSSVVFEEEAILKVYRRLEPGLNPELEILRFLTEHGFPHIAPLGGWYAYAGRPLEVTLGLLQQFVPNALDGWELALDELAEAPERFLGRLRRLGEVTGSLHTTLASELADPAFCPEEIGTEKLGLITATVDEEIARLFLELPEIDEVAPIFGRGEEIREQLSQLTHLGHAGRMIRHHGDYHLGQTLWTGNDWLVIDFEGEPARPLPERRRKRSPLRDVAGMLRSFAYAASAAPILRGARPPADWESRAREEFLDAYLATVDQTVVPPNREAFDRLLSVFELEKAIYELRYELNNRPDWVPIPVAGIARLLEAPAPAA